MKLYLLKLGLGCALVLGSLASSASAPDEVRYAPVKGLKLTRTCETSGAFSMDSLSVSLDGQDQPVPETPDVAIESEEKIVVTDVLEAVGKGRPDRLVRSFDSLREKQHTSGKGPGGQDIDRTENSVCDLEGKRVAFTWSEDDQEYSVEAAKGQELDEALLSGLDEDMDLRGMLPDKAVAKGDSWDVEPAAFRAVLWPGGRLPYHSESQDEPDPAMVELREGLYA